VRRSLFVLVATFLLLASLLVACGDDGGGSAGDSSGEFGTGLKLGKVLNTAPVGASVEPWYRWNGQDCKFEVADDHPDEYTAEVREVKGGADQIGYMHYGNTDPFGVDNSKSIEAWADKAGLPLDVYNLKFPSRTEPLAAARSALTKQNKGVIQANLDPTTLPGFFRILEGDGCIPSVQLYLPIEDRPAMGNHWPDVGTEIGVYVAKEAADRGWKPEDTALVQCNDSSVGPTVNIMFKRVAEAMAANGFELPDSNVFDLDCKAAENQAGFRQINDWYTSHPQFKRVALTTIDTIRMPNMIRAAQRQGRPREDYIAGAGADDESSRKLVRAGDQDVSISFFGERFGEYAIPMLQDLMAGEPVPEFLGTELVPLTKDNVDKYYPE
jgi:ribose transport system substrate-binding protein